MYNQNSYIPVLVELGIWKSDGEEITANSKYMIWGFV